MKFREDLKNIKPYKPGLTESQIKEKYKINKVVKLASNENPYGKSFKAQEKINKSIVTSRYPDNYCTKLRNVLVNKYNLVEDNFIFGNGSVEIIQMLSRAFIGKDDEIITCNPTFQSYILECLIQGGKCIDAGMIDYKFNLNGILEKISNKTKIIYIANPNNPTGTIIEKAEMETFIKKVPESILIVFDEAYSEFVNNKEYPNSIEYLKEHKNICILKTFSKAYGLADLRIGYGISSEEVINELEKVRLPFNVTKIAEDAAIEAIKDQDFLRMCIKNNREVIEYVYSVLRENNIDYIETEANFIMINTKKNGVEISEKLQQKGFIVRPNFEKMDTFIRVTIGTKEEMTEFLKCFLEVLKES